MYKIIAEIENWGIIEFDDDTNIINILIKKHFFPIPLKIFLQKRIVNKDEQDSIFLLFEEQGLDINKIFNNDNELIKKFKEMLIHGQKTLKIDYHIEV